MFKRFLCVSFLVVFLVSAKVCAEPKFDSTLPLKGQSIASKLLQFDTLKAVYSVASVYNTRCQSYSVADTKLIHPIKDGTGKNGRYLTGYWKEAWVVNRCSQQVEIPILFTLDGKGGAYYQINPKEITVKKQ